MASAIYILKKEKDKGESDPLLIVLHYRVSGDQKLIYSTGQKIAPKNWSKQKQRARPSYTKATELNAYLDKLAERVDAAALAIRTEGRSVTREELRQRIHEKQKSADEQHEKNNVLAFLNDFIEIQRAEHRKEGRNAADIGVNTLKIYSTLRIYLTGYCKQHGILRLTFDHMDQPFFDSFKRYLRTKQNSLGNNSLIKYLRTLKALLRKAVRLKYTTSREFELAEINVSAEESEAIFLTEGEIASVYSCRKAYEAWDNGESLQIEADRLVLGCCIGMRFGDSITIQPEHVVRRTDGVILIKLKTQKTGELISVPLLHPAAIEILERYGWASPPPVTSQHANRTFKTVCSIAGINEPVTLSTGENVPKWQLVTTHTMRRSFATNHYLNGVPSIILMRFTGHRSERSFFKYIRIDRLQAADQIIKHYAERAERGIVTPLLKIS